MLIIGRAAPVRTPWHATSHHLVRGGRDVSSVPMETIHQQQPAFEAHRGARAVRGGGKREGMQGRSGFKRSVFAVFTLFALSGCANRLTANISPGTNLKG